MNKKNLNIRKDKTNHTIELGDNKFLTELYGNHDENLSKIEGVFDVEISYRGNILEIKGHHDFFVSRKEKFKLTGIECSYRQSDYYR